MYSEKCCVLWSVLELVTLVSRRVCLYETPIREYWGRLRSINEVPPPPVWTPLFLSSLRKKALVSRACNFLYARASCCLSPSGPVIRIVLVLHSLVKVICLLSISDMETWKRNCSTEHHGRIVSTLTLYSGWTGYVSRPGEWVSLLRVFLVFLSPSRQMPGYLKIRSLTHPTKSFPIRRLSLIIQSSTLYS
jgi:hypothetical protein